MTKDVLVEMRESLIKARALEERNIEEFGKAIMSVDIAEVFGDTYIPPVFTLKALCPEAYEEFPNVEVYDKQFTEMSKIISDINNKVIQYNEEAMKCIQEYKMIS